MRKDDLAIEFQKIDEEVVLLDRLIMIKTQRTLDSIELRAAAFSITSIYNGLEKILLLLLGESCMQSSPTWHADLLAESKSREFISEDLYMHLAAFLGFRHFVRHAYSFEIKNEPVEAILDSVKTVVEDFKREITAVQ